MIQVLEERDFPGLGALSARQQPLARQVGQFRGRTIRCTSSRGSISARRDIGLFSAGRRGVAGVCAEGRRRRLHRHRQHLGVPLRGRHPAGRARSQPACARAVHRRAASSPTRTARPSRLVVALKPIHDAVGIERINVATYQSVSGAGTRGGGGAGGAERSRCMSGQGPVQARVVPKQIAFNCVPQIDKFRGQRLHQGGDEDGLGDPQDPGGPHHPGERYRRAGAGVLRPLRGGHIETATKITAAEARALLEKAPAWR